MLIKMIAIMAFVTAFAGTIPAFATPRTPGFNEVERCRKNNDPFAVPAYVFGLLPGEGRDGPIGRRILKPSDTGTCVDQQDYRPILTLSDEEASAYGFENRSDRISVANVRAIDGWYTASIPFNAAREAFFLVIIRKMVVLGLRGSHAQLRIKFNEPVILTPQWPANPANRIETDELLFSANPTGFDGPSRYNPIKNFDGSLLNARGIHTREESLKHTFSDFYAKTEKQYNLDIAPWELALYIKKYIERAAETRLSQRFILSHRNCDSTQFEILDSVLSHRYQMIQKPFDPEFAKQRLLERKLITENSELQPFETEPWAQDVFAKYPRKDEE